MTHVGTRSTVAAVTAAMLVTGSPSRAFAAAPVVSNAHVQLSGAVAIPDTSDVVVLSGLVHVVTRVVAVEDGHLITVYANLPANVSAEGPQELRFIAHGASKHSDVHSIRPGEIIPCVMPGFTLLLADQTNKSISPIAFSIRLELGFNESGELVSGVALVGRGVPT
jgi:hypothetical protein